MTQRDEPPPRSTEPRGSGRSAEDAVDRPGARVLLLDASNRLLLLRAIVDPDDPAPIWITPGGGVEVGETHVEAARRELREELNLDDLDLSRCVWTREHVWYWTLRDQWIATRERFYVAHLDEEAPDLTLYPDEMLIMDDLRWWTLTEIETTEETVSPRGLAQLLPPILAGDYPDPPIDAGV
jgi:8-oxo-dGTP pyrophosphatase MutT (NUDIX family)